MTTSLYEKLESAIAEIDAEIDAREGWHDPRAWDETIRRLEAERNEARAELERIKTQVARTPASDACDAAEALASKIEDHDRKAIGVWKANEHSPGSLHWLVATGRGSLTYLTRSHAEAIAGLRNVAPTTARALRDLAGGIRTRDEKICGLEAERDEARAELEQIKNTVSEERDAFDAELRAAEAQVARMSERVREIAELRAEVHAQLAVLKGFNWVDRAGTMREPGAKYAHCGAPPGVRCSCGTQLHGRDLGDGGSVP